MGIYDSFEQYLPEMKDVRARYDLYLKENNLNKTAEQKLFDYLALISKAYCFDKSKMMTEFSVPDIANTLQQDNSQCMYSVILPISERMRFREMKDKAEFSSFVNNEIFEQKEGIKISPECAWTYKRFPAHEILYKNRPDIVRYALNVKPGLGLFKKLDNLCLKYDVFDYKIINEQIYNQRTDPVIIYARKENQKEMLEDLEKVIRPYRRHDEYDMVGYSNCGNGIFIADEVKKEDVIQLKYNALTKEEKDVFTHPVEDEFEQDDREYNTIKSIRYNKESCPAKCAFIFWITKQEHDYALSSAQFQAAKMVVDAYRKTQENSLSQDYTKQSIR